MRYFTVVFPLLLLLVSSSPRLSSTTIVPAQESVVIEKRTVVLIRSRKFARDYPSRKKATISYPYIKSGVSNPRVLAKIRSLVKLKNIFETSIEEYKAETWLDELDYRINYNKNFILDITFREDGMGAYPDYEEKHLAINLKTGELIKASDVFKPEGLVSLAALVDRKLQAELKETIEQVNADPSTNAEEKAQVPELYENLKFEVAHLDDFEVSDNGITFLYDAGFPHVVQAYEPDGKYQFTYAELSKYLKRDGAPRSLTQ